MRALVQDYLKEHETVVRESASYGARVDDEIGGSTETSEFWTSAVSTMQEEKLPREALLRTAATIQGRTGWEDPFESLSVHAYIAKSQHEALMEEKRRGNFDDTREGNFFKRQTRGDKAREAASQELPFTEETFEELKIGSDGSLLPEEITCFKKMLAKQGRSFAFEAHEIGRLYSSSQKLIDCLTIGESPYYLLQLDARRVLEQESTIFGRSFWWGVFKGQGMHMDPSIASLFQAFSLSMQQQQSNDRKEALATKALQAVVNKIDQFDGRNISRYLRCYIREMEFNRVSEKKMVALFGLAMIPKIRDHITSITDRCGNSWENFSHALKDEYFLEDADRVTKKLFLEWIERPNKNLQATELLREFERQYSRLSKVEKLTLELNKVDLFLQAADGELQGKLELLLKDKEEDEGLTTNIKQKRQLMSETGMSHAIDARICRDEEEVDIGYKQPTNEKNGYNQRVCFEDSSDKEMETLSHYTRKHWARATTEVLVKVGDIEEPIVALVDHGSEINLMSKDLYKKQKWPIDMEHGWTIRAANNTRGELYGACPDVKIWIGDVAMEQHFFVQDTTSYPLILGQPYITATRMETKVLDDGSLYARVRSEDERKAVQFLTVPPNHERNRDRLREKPLPKILEGFKDLEEEVLSRDEGAFDASFIGILENRNIMYKKVDDFKRKERKRLYDIEGQLRKIGTLQDDERILGVYEENGLEDSLELITSIGLGDNDKIVEIHSREVYTMLESFQAPEVTVETRYKTTDKKVKPVVGPLPKDSIEQMGEASKEASLRDPVSIGHQFTEETFEELKIGSDGSLLPEEITCFKKMLAKQGRSFAFEAHEIGCVDLNIITPMVIFTVPHQEDESDMDNEGDEDELDKDVGDIF
uniref:Predicted protein n=1 Tax=Physcomitrium patens TaxID=3218 RepID=A9U4H0_PHYPA